MSEQQTVVSSPNSTGGGGTHFEQHVDAAFLAWLLVRAVPPVLKDCTLSAVHSQTERLGWQTDDLVAVGENAAGEERKLVCQVKQTIKVSAADHEFKKTIKDAWGDFRNSEMFDRSRDRLAIITLRGTDAFLRHFAGLLDCARASRTAGEFETRLGINGFVHAKVVHYFGEIKQIIRDDDDDQFDQEETWEFLRLLHTLSFDLNTSTGQTESQVKSLLAHTAGGPDPMSAANATWNELLREVGEGKPNAKSYGREDLTQEIRDRHSPIGNREQASLQRLTEHSKPILDGIRTTIGLPESNIELRRDGLVQTILEQIQDSDIVLISGNAGSGKSAAAKRVLEHVAPDYFTFTFRAEEFAASHLDETLLNAQTDVNGVLLGAILSGQSKKLLLIESVERLLEATTRDAFADLLSLLPGDPSWRLILTCRDYSTDLVRSSLLQLVNVGHAVVSVPSLTDAELDSVADACPAVGQALANDRLRKLLRNPYMLDKATQMPWPKERPLPQNERAFRDRFWAELIRVNHNSANGMPRRRKETFTEVALRRARALTLYATRDGLDEEAVDQLIHDSLLTASDRTDSLVGPAHDVLEDWAILNWIDEQHVRCDDDLSSLSEILGTFPAIRRSYRKWLDELVERDPNGADALFTQALTEPSIPAQFRDDTLVSLLRSSDPGEFVQRHTELLFSRNKRLLRRIIHLLRVGCVTTPEWFEGGVGLDFDFHVPDGKAWPCVLELVSSRLTDFSRSDTGLLLGLIEDAAKGVSWQTPYPPGSESIVAVAHWLIPHFDDYRNEKQLKRTLSVIAKLPKCDEAGFRSLLAKKERQSIEDRNKASEEFREMILSGMEGNAACRDFPDAVIDATRDCMFLTEKHLKESRRFGFSSMELEPAFGIRPYMRHDAFPASAYQGPFFFLLRHHFALGNKFLIELFNHSAEWYSSRRVPMEYVEPPFTIRLTFTDGTTRDQWANGRLWNLYRGTSVGPNALQSALMALERRLLEVAEIRPDVIDALLIDTLRASESGAITAVAASVAAAHPHVCPETLLVLLQSRECIQLDHSRMVHESQRPSRLAAILPSFSRDKTHDHERKEADELPHRSRDLENAIANLQLGPNASRVHEIIDQHLRTIPAADQRADEDRIWLLSLRRMDVRHYETTGEIVEEAKTESDSDAEPRKMIRLDLRVDDQDVEAMSRESAAQHAELDKRLGLEMWGIKVFEGDDQSHHDPGMWKSKLQEGRELSANPRHEGLGRGGPEFIAAVCIRDHFDELGEDDVRWCVETVCNAIEDGADNWGRMDRIQSNSMEADRPCAWVVSALIDKPMSDELSERVRNALASAISHSNNEVRTYATDGVSRNLWESNADLAMRCVNVLACEAAAVQSLWKVEQEKPFGERAELEAIEFDVGQRMRSLFYSDILEDAHEQLDVTDWIGSEANCRILSILQRAPHDPAATDAFRRLAEVLVKWWDEDDERRYNNERRERSQNAAVSLPRMLESFVLRVSTNAAATILAPILEAVDRHPREVSRIIQGIVSAEDCFPSKTSFWPVWQLFADCVKRASWLSQVDREHSEGAEVFSAIFLTQYWKKGIRHWQALSEGAPNGHAHRVHELFDALPPTSNLLDNYVRFLFHIGETCLPDAFTRIAPKLQSGDAPDMLRRSNTVFMLESLLRRYVYSRPIELKSKASMRESVLYLLDTLVESGSSSAYRMRDDFVTPLST